MRPIFAHGFAKNKVHLIAKRTSAKLQSECVVFSGIQPTGVPHIGNYLGAIKQWKNLQDQPGTKYFSIVDLHSLTSKKLIKTELQENILATAISLLACGLDPKKCVIFQQSQILNHTSLAWILSTLVSVSKTSNLTHWKEKSQTKDAGNIGLFTYPILQAADILLYKATHVPVGADQTQHVELTRDLLLRFNNKYGNFFPTVEHIILNNSKRVKSLRNPSIKMSKSDVTSMGRVELLDTPESVAKKVRKAVTDNISKVSYNPKERPGVSNLLSIHSAIANVSIESIVQNCEQDDMNVFQYKVFLTETLNDFLKPIQTEYNLLAKDKQYVYDQLLVGSEKAQETASENWKAIKSLVGLQI